MAAQALQKMATTEDGQIVLAWLTARFGYTRRSTKDGPNGIEFNEGQRSVMIELGTLLDADVLRLKEIEEHDLAKREAMASFRTP